MRGFFAEIWRTRFGKFTTVVLVLNLLFWLGGIAGVVPAAGAAKSFLRFLLILCLVYYASRYFGAMRRRLLWRLRNRLLIAYVFIAIIPILLILSMATVAGYLLYGQLATYLTVSELERDVERLRVTNHAVVADLSVLLRRREVSAAEAAAVLETHRQEIVREFPDLECGAILPGGHGVVVPAGGVPLELPAWLKAEYHGLARAGSRLYVRSVDSGTAGGRRFVIYMSAPVSPEFLESIGRDVGLVDLILMDELRPGQSHTGAILALGERRFVQGHAISQKRAQLPPPAYRFDLRLSGFSTYDVGHWDAPPGASATIPILLSVTSRPSLLNRKLFSTLGALSILPFTILVVIGVVFLVIEFFALVTGILLTRTITGAVADIYEGTLRVKVGDFSYRIPYPAERDQLSTLAESFNTMTASIERLIEESKEKQRLEGELAIAREVQTQLFPKAIPAVPGLEVAAVCHPARTVSGDYYDLIQLAPDRLGLAIADISGKGISAALLMASIQSALRTNLASGRFEFDGRAAAAELIARMNRHLLDYAPAEKYATFCYIVYDARRRSLTYTNAGHPPPLLFADNQVRRLDVGGTVVGLFDDARFQQDEIAVSPGTLLVAYSDGITEPENSFGEQFGERRLVEVVTSLRGAAPDQIVREVMAALADWQSAGEQEDDMTLLVARVR